MTGLLDPPARLLHPAVVLRVITGNLRRHPAPPGPAGSEAGPRITEVPKSLSSR